MNRNTKTIAGLIVVVVLLAVVVYFGVGVDRKKTGEQVTQLDSGDELVTAAQGAVVGDFPQELLLEDGVAVDSSYSMRYLDNGLTQPVVEYMSELTLEENIELFGTHFAAEGWMIEHIADSEDAPITYYYATRGNEQANVTFLEGPDYKVKVTLAYAVSGQ